MTVGTRLAALYTTSGRVASRPGTVSCRRRVRGHVCPDKTDMQPGVSDPIRAALRAKSGAADPGSLTPRLPRTPSSPAALGCSRGKRRRAVWLQQPPSCQRHPSARPLAAAAADLGALPSRTISEGERCSRVFVPPPRSPIHASHAEPTREERWWYPRAKVSVVTRPRPLASASSRIGDTVPWRRRLPSFFHIR